MEKGRRQMFRLSAWALGEDWLMLARMAEGTGEMVRVCSLENPQGCCLGVDSEQEGGPCKDSGLLALLPGGGMPFY